MNLEPTGEIIAKEHRAYNGRLERIEWEWRGGDLAYLSDRMMLGGFARINDGIITAGPLRLRIVTYCPGPRGWMVARDGLRAKVIYRVYRYVQHVEGIYRRLILTAAVWGLAGYNWGVLPTWRDVYALNKIAGWLGK